MSLLKLACCCLASRASFSGSYARRAAALPPELVISLIVLPSDENICPFKSFDCKPPKYPPTRLSAPPPTLAIPTARSMAALPLILSILSLKVAWMPCCSSCELLNKPSRSLLESLLRRSRRSKKEKVSSVCGPEGMFPFSRLVKKFLKFSVNCPSGPIAYSVRARSRRLANSSGDLLPRISCTFERASGESSFLTVFLNMLSKACVLLGLMITLSFSCLAYSRRYLIAALIWASVGLVSAGGGMEGPVSMPADI